MNWPAYSLDTHFDSAAAKWSTWHALSGYKRIFLKHRQDPENLASHVYIPAHVATGRWIISDSGERKDVSDRTSVSLGLITPLY